MLQIGKLNTLKIVKEVDFGLYLDGGEEYGEILLPKRYVPEKFEIEDNLEVFIYRDSEDRIIATTETPIAMVGDFALMEVASVNDFGAFLEWGLQKELLVPFREQKNDMEKGKSYVVYVYLDDETKRIAASSKLNKFLDNIPVEYEPNQEVNLFIASKTDLGYNAIINGVHWGILYENEVFKPLERGQKIKAFIKKVREDEKIDLYLHKAGYDKVDALTNKILETLKDEGGFLEINDKTPSTIIYEVFGESKKTFKKALGTLYKKRLIDIEKRGIKLLKNTN
ncbi:MAG: GntR family transcriptional regulator [Bacteroidetes bacterium]|nr:MAG: GntR family transcriptional regulator [Bacteroidota bacterium]